MMGRNPARTVVACLSVQDIRAIEPPAPLHGLDVQWERAVLPDGTPNTHPGADGHTGIYGLIQGGKKDSNGRKALRSRLADIARISPVPVPHQIPEAEISEVAFSIWEREGPMWGAAEAHWVRAIRQLRRARVAEHEQRTRAS